MKKRASNGQMICKCICICGTTFYRPYGEIKRGRDSCGCKTIIAGMLRGSDDTADIIEDNMFQAMLLENENSKLIQERLKNEKHYRSTKRVI